MSSGTTAEIPANQTVITPSTGVGDVTGTVYDASDGSYIEGAVVIIGNLSATTSSGGAYYISGITPGSQTITASKTRYDSYSSTVSVVADAIVTQDIYLSSGATKH